MCGVTCCQASGEGSGGGSKGVDGDGCRAEVVLLCVAAVNDGEGKDENGG